MMFERHYDGGFAAPAEYPPLAAASAATHDLATLAGFWLGRDITWRKQLGLYPDVATETAEEAARSRDRRLLLQALVVEGLLEPKDLSRYLSGGRRANLFARPRKRDPMFSRPLARPADAGSALEDVVGESEPANLPGTIDGHPNWRRHLSRTIENIIEGSELRRTASVVEEARQALRPSTGGPPVRNPDPRHLPPAIPPRVHLSRRYTACALSCRAGD